LNPRRTKKIGGCRKLHNEELHNLYPSLNVIIAIKSRRMRLAGHVAPIRENRNAYRASEGSNLKKREH
jgi:hypothetical protein